MTFQFLCPHGHLLQGEEAHMGMQCECPQCGVAFIIPTVERGAGSVGASSPQAPDLGLAPVDDVGSLAGIGAVREDPAAIEGLDVGAADPSDFPADELNTSLDETLLHIPCPNGHELEVPMDMVGQKAMCPHCGAEFRLKRERSIEYIFQQEAVDRRRGEFWLRMAIIAAFVVGIVLLIMIAAVAMT
jgi:hypothetical protein